MTTRTPSSLEAAGIVRSDRKVLREDPRAYREPAGTVATRVVQAKVPVSSIEALSLRARQLGMTPQELAGLLVAHGLASPALRP